MKIGDKVRFLSEVGGGKVAGFKGNNIVLVEDEDGFQIPMPVNEVVKVDTDDYSTANVINRRSEAEERKQEKTALRHGARSVKAMMSDGQDEDIDMTVEDVVDDTKEVTFRPQAEERKGGNQLSVFLAFLPLVPNDMANPRFEVYFVNDSNYYLQYSYMEAEGNGWTLKTQAEVEPNTKIFIEEIGREEINHLDRVAVQLMAYKREKSFVLKPTVQVELRLDPIKFYKMHTFQDSAFFESPALIYTIVENDRPARPLTIDPKELKREMYAGGSSDRSSSQVFTHTQRDHLVGRYTNDQRKGGRHAPYTQRRESDEPVIVDLHADKLLDSMAGMQPGEILEYQLKVFRDTLAQYATKKGCKIIFIHGKGEGVLRRALISDLTYRYKGYTYQDASFQEYGYGATQVTIK